MRSRKFFYKTINADVEYLRSIPCDYHIYGIDGENLEGFISFPFTKTVSAAEKLIGCPTVISEKKTLEMIAVIRGMSHVWEKGEPPQRNRTPVQEQSAKIMSKLIHLLQTEQEENQRLQMKLEESLKQQIASSANCHIDARDYSNNKKITNIQVFLNTECKDAITLVDFIKQIEISDEDLICLKEYGYVESVTRLLQRALKDYDVYKRPIHCTDMKREVLHVKVPEGWKKENPKGESPAIDKAFRQISHKHTRKLTEYYKDISVESAKFEEKAAVIYKLAHAAGSEEESCKKKIIHNLSQSIHI
jgi:hypothetical protein